jgi:hypothetical protein
MGRGHERSSMERCSRLIMMRVGRANLGILIIKISFSQGFSYYTLNRLAQNQMTDWMLQLRESKSFLQF